MDLTLIQQFAQYGIFGGLFIALFIYTLKNNKEREDKLTDTLNNFAEKVGDKLTTVCTDLNAVKADIEDIKGKIN